jgi:hypothetical protein
MVFPNKEETMKIRMQFAGLAVALCLVAHAHTARAALYDVSTQFDANNNPSSLGPWSYGYKTSLTNALALYTNNLTVNSVDFWQAAGGGAPVAPLALENQLGTTRTNAYLQSILPGDQFALQPGPNGVYSVVRWTAPSNGLYAVSVLFTAMGTTIPMTADVHLVYNNTISFSSVVTGYSRVAGLGFTGNLAAGDRLDFAVGNGGDEHTNDIVGINATIGTVDPSSDTLPPTISISATPTVLFPPNRKMVNVTVSGTVVDASGVARADFFLADEYGRLSASGQLTLTGGQFSFQLPLQASRKGFDRDGRQYVIYVGATDNLGNYGFTSVTIVVPHSRRPPR